MARTELCERRGVHRQLRHGSVDQVSGHRDQVGIQLIDTFNDALDETALDGRPDVHIGDLGDREPMQGFRQAHDGNVHVDQTRSTSDGQPRHRYQQRERHRPSRRRCVEGGRVAGGQCNVSAQQEQIPQQGRHEQRSRKSPSR